MKTKITFIVLILLMLTTAVVYAQGLTQLNPGVYEFECLTGRLRHSFINNDVNLVRLNCTTNGEGVVVVPTPTAIPTAMPTATPIAPTATPTEVAPTASGFDCAIPQNERNFVCAGELSQRIEGQNLSGQVCPDWVHDKYLVSARQEGGLWRTFTGEQSPVYWRTWHPQVDGETGCTFNHEHGANPTESLADNSYPAFGLFGCLHEISHMGVARGGHCTEPHEGFKVFVAPQGFVNDEGRTFNYNSRIVAHFGTSREGRFTQPSHSFQQSMRSNDGTVFAHFSGMFNSGLSGNICQRDASLNDGNFNNDIGRTLYENPATSTCRANSPYEIWTSEFNVVSPSQGDPNENYRVMRIGNSVAAFDTSTFYTENNGVKSATPTGMLGCDREAYHESPYWYVRDWGITQAYTDMHGNEIPFGTLGGNLQYWSVPNASSGVGYGQLRMTNDSSVMKRREPSYCNPFIQFPN